MTTPKDDAIDTFVNAVEVLIHSKQMTTMEACLEWATQRGYDPEYVGGLLKKSNAKSKALRSKIRDEGLALRMLSD